MEIKGIVDVILLDFLLLTGHVLECSLAKPQVDQKSGASGSQKSPLDSSFPPLLGYGLVGGAYGGLGAGFGPAGFGQVRYFFSLCLLRLQTSAFLCSFVIVLLEKVGK